MEITDINRLYLEAGELKVKLMGWGFAWLGTGPHGSLLEASQFVEVDVLAYKQAWARLFAKAYEIDPLVCPKCGGEMKVIAVIENPDENRRILRHLVKVGRSPPGFDPDRLENRGVPQRGEECSRH